MSVFQEIVAVVESSANKEAIDSIRMGIEEFYQDALDGVDRDVGPVISRLLNKYLPDHADLWENLDLPRQALLLASITSPRRDPERKGER
jgi:hypothetical protein